MSWVSCHPPKWVIEVVILNQDPTYVVGDAKCGFLWPGYSNLSFLARRTASARLWTFNLR